VSRLARDARLDPAPRIAPWNAGVVDDDVESGMLGDQASHHGVDAARMGDVELDRLRAGIGSDDLVKIHMPTSRDDHLVVELVERFGEAAAMPEPPPVMKIVLPVSFMGWLRDLK
jgi:hypothetical protein